MSETDPAPARPTMAWATFLELVPPQAVGLAATDRPRGKMPIQWNGATASDWPDSDACCYSSGLNAPRRGFSRFRV